MQIEAIYDCGQIRFTTPIKLRCDHVRLLVEIPDDLLDTGEMEDINPVFKTIHNMLGDDYHYVPSGKTDKDILIEALEEKYCR